MIHYPKSSDESVVEWYRRAEFQHRYRRAFGAIIAGIQAGLMALHEYTVPTGIEHEKR